jgi:hypothetical protein
VISKGLRISIGVTSRLHRIATDKVLIFKEWVIPFGVNTKLSPKSLKRILIKEQTLVSESGYFILINESIFPDPTKFRPDRWLKDSKYNPSLERYLVNFRDSVLV